MVKPGTDTAPLGTYILFVLLDHQVALSIGRLGDFDFPAGYYSYVGSARGPGGLEARLARHLRAGKRPRWHIDYLLQVATATEIWQVSSSERLECRWAEALLHLPGATLPVPGFGSSDCGCHAHLLLFEAMPSLTAFRTQVNAVGLTSWISRVCAGKLAVHDDEASRAGPLHGSSCHCG
jgi:Uri superfamily endonuclease